MEKTTNDDYPSYIKERYDDLIGNQELFEEKISGMNESEILSFYKYVESVSSSIEEVDFSIWFVKTYLESLEVVQNYRNESLERPVLTFEEEQSIEDTVRVLEQRRHPSPFKKLIKYFKGN